ncbi:MAG: FkbM family methyltransferase [Magnetococcales bacterium]|nr:FkbM family methyltransferase [Magnetococcales bacterium]
MDVGARGGIDAIPWSNMLSLIDVISFEPEADELKRMLARKRENDQILGTALHRDVLKIPLHVTKAPGCSSLYEPNIDFLKQFPNVERFDIVNSPTIETNTIDQLHRSNVIKDVDFVKLDVQGAELDILEGGKHFLSKNVLALEVEIEFQPLYKNQPFFADVDPVV